MNADIAHMFITLVSPRCWLHKWTYWWWSSSYMQWSQSIYTCALLSRGAVHLISDKCSKSDLYRPNNIWSFSSNL